MLSIINGQTYPPIQPDWLPGVAYQATPGSVNFLPPLSIIMVASRHEAAEVALDCRSFKNASL